MRRRLLPLVVLTALATVPSGGCRSCDSCHDYDGPVTSCNCDSCGHGRSGSGSGGYVASGGPIGGPMMADDEVGYE
jgi:hypothetical protein